MKKEIFVLALQSFLLLWLIWVPKFEASKHSILLIFGLNQPLAGTIKGF